MYDLPTFQSDDGGLYKSFASKCWKGLHNFPELLSMAFLSSVLYFDDFVCTQCVPLSSAKYTAVIYAQHILRSLFNQNHL